MPGRFFVVKEKLPAGFKGRLVVKDGGGKIMRGPYSEGTREGGPWYEISDASHYFKDWEKRGWVEEV